MRHVNTAQAFLHFYSCRRGHVAVLGMCADVGAPSEGCYMKITDH